MRPMSVHILSVMVYEFMTYMDYIARKKDAWLIKNHINGK